MSSCNAIIDFLLSPAVLRATLVTTVFTLALCTDLGKGQPGHPRWQWFTQLAKSYALPIAIPTLLGWVWLTLVNAFVPRPYMDEIFHVPQAQVYCEGKYAQWDDKITTPPGLYFLSIIWARLSGYGDCSLETLRRFNLFIIACTAVVAAASRAIIEGPSAKGQLNSAYSIHTGINIALFPVLFFFSGLYYTDVISTFVVLIAYLNHRRRLGQGNRGRSVVNDLYTVFLGVLALFMRQTNVFWVVVYMGGCEAVQAIKDLPVAFEKPSLDTWAAQAKFFVQKSSIGAIHDPVLQNAWPEDLLLCLLSIGIAAVCNLGAIFRRIYPQIVVVALFAGFVLWNGGVVLGDKSNHVATLHLAQMLYIWPLFAFFSAPLVLPQTLHVAQGVQSYFMSQWPLKSTGREGKSGKNAQRNANYLGIALSVVLLGGSTIGAGLIVHYNTIIHPFTLADNRHYMFYVFRYTIMRGSTIRLLLAPVYVSCAVLVWTSLYQNNPDAPTKPKSGILNKGSSRSTVLTSEVLILLVTITLSLITAPLVEPRYFILPWVFWRLLVPRRTGGKREALDWVLFLETAWFLVVNAVLMYIFLTRPFVWKLEGHELDGGAVQRFMW
ncbi:DIE2/ALG10 family-domain-containing protein [Truncatella angustata]|uniref:Dol-P-Glc:Glc(2)Man(9)GlcNAc(2)-PP-Dol alpha-1,2-glucosyltransferase n=1 Tax=Truncatella angustata TaxID=152316 RepID=A0A9P9A3N2_9PEZI|nr:DIE2/ALG10 family-domain-containing protein [Truncatella angustata]KAH6659089.1 DIE2/ALG10 family-domain-containing protein [Truncatella angustata]